MMKMKKTKAAPATVAKMMSKTTTCSRLIIRLLLSRNTPGKLQISPIITTFVVSLANGLLLSLQDLSNFKARGVKAAS